MLLEVEIRMKKGLLKFCIVILLGFISTIIVGTCDTPKYSLLFLLPSSFVVCSFVFINELDLFGKSIAATLLIALLFIKNIITPIFMALGNGAFNSSVDVTPYMPMAIFLEIFEEITVFLTLKLYRKKLIVTAQNENTNIEFNRYNIRVFGIFTAIITLLVIAILIRYPQLVYYVTIGVTGDKDKSIQEAIIKSNLKNGVPSMIYYSYTYFVNLLRWTIPIFVVFKEYVNNKHSEFKKIIISYIMILISTMLTIDTVAVSGFIFVSLSLVIVRLYPKYRSIITKLLILSVICAGVFALLIKSFGTEGASSIEFSDLSRLFQAYFSGPENVAVSLAISKSVTLNELVGSVFKFIPYIMYFFRGYTTSNSLFNEVYWGKTGIETQIIPMIAQGARYFTVILAPVFTFIVTRITVRQEVKAKSKNTLFGYTTSIIWCVCFSLAVAMYSASLCIQLFLNYIFPIIVFAWICLKVSFGKGGKYD